VGALEKESKTLSKPVEKVKVGLKPKKKNSSLPPPKRPYELFH